MVKVGEVQVFSPISVLRDALTEPWDGMMSSHHRKKAISVGAKMMKSVKKSL